MKTLEQILQEEKLLEGSVQAARGMIPSMAEELALLLVTRRPTEQVQVMKQKAKFGELSIFPDMEVLSTSERQKIMFELKKEFAQAIAKAIRKYS